MSLRSNRLLNWNHFILFQTTPRYQETGRDLPHSLSSTKLPEKTLLNLLHHRQQHSHRFLYKNIDFTPNQIWLHEKGGNFCSCNALTPPLQRKRFQERIHLVCRLRELSRHHQRLNRLPCRHLLAPTTPGPPPSITKLENERSSTQTLAAPKPLGGERTKQKSYLQN